MAIGNKELSKIKDKDNREQPTIQKVPTLTDSRIIVLFNSSFPHKNGIHVMKSPTAIIIRSHIDCQKNCEQRFGSFVPSTSTTKKSLLPQTSRKISLQPTGNIQGSYKFLYLNSGKCIPDSTAYVHQSHNNNTQVSSSMQTYKGIVFTD